MFSDETAVPELRISIDPGSSRETPLRLYRQNHCPEPRSRGRTVVLRGLNDEEASTGNSKNGAAAQVTPIRPYGAGERLPELFFTRAQGPHRGHEGFVASIGCGETVPLFL